MWYIYGLCLLNLLASFDAWLHCTPPSIWDLLLSGELCISTRLLPILPLWLFSLFFAVWVQSDSYQGSFSFKLSLGHLIHNTGFNDQIMSHTQSSTPRPCFFKSFDASALTKNETGFFTKANEDPLDLIAAGLYVSFPMLMSFSPFSRQTD